MVGKALNVRLARGGFVPKMRPLFVTRMVLNILVQELGIPAVRGNLAVESIKHVIVQQIILGTGAVAPFPVHLLINILAQGPATPVAQALPAVENILNARVQAAMNGKTGLVSNKL